ncbi:MAG: FtsX-like permease family protein [Frankia sp.]|nr:FtsX-like permease family protein [Frankia sp.]
MIGLALRSLRFRRTESAATFLAVLLGTILIGSFATLAETAIGLDGHAEDRDALMIMGGVVGGWGSVIVLFSVASTVGITAARRASEIGLLRTIGAAPAQARRLIVAEVAAVAVCAALPGAVVALGTGWLLLAMLHGRLIDESIGYGGGPGSVGSAASLVVLVSVVAAAIAARRATRAPASVTLRESVAEAGRMRWYRVAAALALIVYGAGMGVVTVTVADDSADPYEAMATSGSSSILVGVGLALLAPVLLRWLATPASWLAGIRPGVLLAAHNATRRAHRLAGVLAPVIVLTAAATGTLMLVSIDLRTLPNNAPDADSDTINLLNYVVVGMLSLFAAIMVINSYAAGMADRRLELRRLWLLGAPTSQIRRSVAAEAGIIVGVGLVLGWIASLATIVPFSVARDEGVVPDGQLWIVPLIAIGVVLLTLAAADGAVRRVLRSGQYGETAPVAGRTPVASRAG